MTGLLFNLLAISLCYGNEYAVIANKKIGKLQRAQIKAIFLKKLEVVHDIRMVPINLEPRSSLRTHFDENFLNMSFERLKKYWIKQHYLGHRPPLDMKSEESAILLVKKLDGGITYIESKYIDDDVNVLFKWNDDASN